jgi:hypothetical protein
LFRLIRHQASNNWALFSNWALAAPVLDPSLAFLEHTLIIGVQMRLPRNTKLGYTVKIVTKRRSYGIWVLLFVVIARCVSVLSLIYPGVQKEKVVEKSNSVFFN